MPRPLKIGVKSLLFSHQNLEKIALLTQRVGTHSLSRVRLGFARLLLLMAYDPKKIEPKWQAHWEKSEPFKTEGPTSRRPKYYILDMFPYPSGSGLHIGHPEGYTATDILARYKRAKGFDVLHPMGWDAFGLPAEQYALQTGVHPEITTSKAIVNFKKQLSAIGFSYDWSREISTCAPEYYRWTQQLFLKLYEKGLAYQKEVPVNWCPALKTVLANEEVVDGKSERGGHPVIRQPMKQWMLKITAYAERLLRDLDKLDWPEGTKELQRNWIGRSEGLQARFKIAGHVDELEIFTTRPDTIFGATFMVLAPEHPLVSKITTAAQKSAVSAYVAEASRKSEIARQEQTRDKTGVATGAYALNPASGEKVPIWIADYVMMGYGTGAIMAVPAHDDRDFEFAKTFSLPVKEVVRPESAVEEGTCFSGEGVSVNSGPITGLKTPDAVKKMIEWFEEKSLGKRQIQYKLRDWLFSRQRYWGEPIPILHFEDGTKAPVAHDELPVTLPKVQSYEPSGTGESPLGAIKEWVETRTKDGRKARRETDTMPGSAGSSWYFLRYCDPQNSKEPYSQEAAKHWMPVDLYLGGAEHAVGHLLYARFWTKVLYDVGLCPVDEPFKRLVHQGMILGEDGEKMSKSRGNVINPDDIIDRFGADSLRLYEMFLGPLERDKPWQTQAIDGVHRFLARAWRMCVDEGAEGSSEHRSRAQDVAPEGEDLRLLHRTIKKVTEDIENLRFNTAISQMMMFVNDMTKHERRPRAALEAFTQCLHPFAPHIAEELWELLGRKDSLTRASWPAFDAELARDLAIDLPVQILGKTRGTISVEPGTDQATAEAKAKSDPSIQKHFEGKTIVKVIFVKDRILNFILK